MRKLILVLHRCDPPDKYGEILRYIFTNAELHHLDSDQRAQSSSPAFAYPSESLDGTVQAEQLAETTVEIIYYCMITAVASTLQPYVGPIPIQSITSIAGVVIDLEQSQTALIENLILFEGLPFLVVLESDFFGG